MRALPPGNEREGINLFREGRYTMLVWPTFPPLGGPYVRASLCQSRHTTLALC
jgi:hypothetical protein